MDSIIAFLNRLAQLRAFMPRSLWGLTALGASLVFVKGMNRALLDGLLGFTGGVMVAASFGLLAQELG